MTSNTVESDLHVKMCKKIAQLTKVIYNLNSRADDHESIVEAMKKEHKDIVLRIMQESKNQILAVKSKFHQFEDYDRQLKEATSLLNESEENNKRLQVSLDEFLEKSSLNEKNLRVDYENKLLDLQNKLLERKREYTELVENFSTFQNELAMSKQGKMSEVTRHHEEIQNLKKKFNSDITDYENKQKQLTHVLQETQSKLAAQRNDWQTEKVKLNNENNEKLNKLKSLHEKELNSINSQVKTEQYGKLEKEKNNLTKDFELRKSELMNRVKYLETKLDDSEEESEKCSKLIKELESNIKSKDDFSNSIHLEMGEQQMVIEQLQKKIKDVNEHFLKQDARNEGKSKHFEETIARLSSTLDEKNIDIDQLAKEVQVYKKDNNSLEKKVSHWKQRFTDESTNNNQHSNSLEEQSRLVGQLNKKITDLQTKLHELSDEKKTEILALESKHKSSLLKEHDRHASDIQKFKSESEKIVKESQELLLVQFEKDKQNMLTDHQTLLSVKEKLEHDIQMRLRQQENVLTENAAELKSTTTDLKNARDTSSVLKQQIVELDKQLQSLNSKVGHYENLLNEMKTGASDERMKLIDQQTYLSGEYEKKIQEGYERFNKEMEEKIKTLERNHAYEFEKLKRDDESKLTTLSQQHQDEMEQFRSMKQNEILILNKDISDIKNRYQLSRDEMMSQQLKHQGDMSTMEASVNEEKQNMKIKNENEMEEMKTRFMKDAENKENGWHDLIKGEISQLKTTHQKEMEEIQNGHHSSLNALKSHLTIENEKNIKHLQEEFDKEKEKLHNFLRLENEERQKQLHYEFEAEISLLKQDLAKNNVLRQKEFSVHTSKITNLSKSLEDEKDTCVSLKRCVSEKEDEASAIRKELESKVEEVLAVRRECNSRMRNREDELTGTHQDVLHNTQKEHTREVLARLNEWKEEQAELRDEISSLTIRLNESESRFQQRPSRDEDVQYIHQLEEKIYQQELACQKLNDEKKYYKLELVNREENFNKIFKTSPNVGFMNPVEMNTRKKSSKKR